MGIMDLSVVGSDAASDFHYKIGREILRLMKEEMKFEGNELNTDGPTNVMLVVDEMIIPENQFVNDDEWQKFVARLVKGLKKVIPQIRREYNKEKSEDIKMYLDRYEEMLPRFQKYVSYWEDMEKEGLQKLKVFKASQKLTRNFTKFVKAQKK